MKSKVAVEREMNRVRNMMNRKGLAAKVFYELANYNQALSWVMEDNAASPMTCARMSLEIVKEKAREGATSNG